jgi:hypothetical protein
MTKIAGSGSISQRHGSADPDPYPPQNVMDPQHWFNRLKTEDIASLVGILLFSIQLCTPITLTFSLVPLPPSLCQSTVHTDSVWLGGGGGMMCPNGSVVDPE